MRGLDGSTQVVNVRHPKMKERLRLAPGTRRVTPDQRAGADQQSAENRSNRTRESFRRDECSDEEACCRPECRPPGLLADDPTSPGGKSGDEDRGSQSAGNAADEHASVTEGVSDHRSSCPAYAAEQTTGDK